MPVIFIIVVSLLCADTVAGQESPRLTGQRSPVIAAFEFTAGSVAYPPAQPGEDVSHIGPIVPYFAAAGHQIHGDTYPMTWADDDEIYVSSGDPNWGVKQHGLDIEKFSGFPPYYRISRVNPMFPYDGNGGEGPKPSGLISMNGVLYLAFQNLQGKKLPTHGKRSQHGSDAAIVYSRDHGKTWTPDIRKIKEPMFPGASFGGPAFVNFGRDNKGARDTYVYAISSDQWDNGSHLRLGRVPAGRIQDRAAWEWVSAFQSDGKPAWTSELSQSSPILSDDRYISLPEMVYVAQLKRYLLLTWRLKEDFNPTRGSELIIYDAPEPWGPFTLVHHEKDWESPEITPYCPRVPLKWIKAERDGVSGWLQFSGSWKENSLHYSSHVRPFRIRLASGNRQY